MAFINIRTPFSKVRVHTNTRGLETCVAVIFCSMLFSFLRDPIVLILFATGSYMSGQTFAADSYMCGQTFAAAKGHLVYRIILLEEIRFVRIRIK
jgi:hypothetical protein